MDGINSLVYLKGLIGEQHNEIQYIVDRFYRQSSGKGGIDCEAYEMRIRQLADELETITKKLREWKC